MSLRDLEAELARQLALLNYPPPDWVEPRAGVLDVAIVGAGMCGATLAFALLREGVAGIRLFDAAASGREGPWLAYARMETLRSPKHLVGPDLGLPALTFRAWFEARFGAGAWAALGKIDRVMWAEYLAWFLRVLRLPATNDIVLERIEPAGGMLRLTLRRDGAVETVLARKLVLATGREGSGAGRWPRFVDAALAPGRVAHSGEKIDFAALKGARIAVLGAGASAFDNAATALEAGAGAVHLFARRQVLPQVNKSKAMSYPGFQHGHYRLPDALRWRVTRYAWEAQVPPPRETLLRTTRHANFALRLGTPWHGLRAAGPGIAIDLPGGAERFDFAILGTGFSVDLAARAELAPFAGEILLWRDRYAPPPDEPQEELGLFPYLGDGFEFLEKTPGSAPYLRDIHCFNYGATLSQGALSGDIPGLPIGAERLARRLVEDLFVADADAHLARVVAASEAELEGTPWHDPEEIRRLACPR